MVGGLAQTSPFEVCDAPEGQSKARRSALGPSRDRSLREIADSTERSLRQPAVVIVPLSTAPQAAPPLLVPVQCAGKTAVAVADQIRAVAKERLHRRADELAPGDLARVEEALRTILEL